MITKFKIFENKNAVNEYGLTREQIKSLLYDYKVAFYNYEINDDLSVDIISGSGVKLIGIEVVKENLNEIPIKFNIVHGTFKCINSNLTTLKNSPVQIIDGDFDCKWNNLTNLIGCTKIINGYLDCSYNPLTSLEGFPDKLTGMLYMIESWDKLKSLDGLPADFDFEFIKLSNNSSDENTNFRWKLIYNTLENTSNIKPLINWMKINKDDMPEYIKDKFEYLLEIDDYQK